MTQNYRVLRARPARRRLTARAAAALVLMAVGLSLTACGSSSAPAPSVSDAYRSAHPTEGIPDTLRTVEMSRDEVARRIAGIVGKGVSIVLPASLPAGFRPAAPYIAVGDGTARPNPEGWGRSYRISYTDGRGLLVMTVGAESRPEGVAWGARRLRIDDRPARAGRAGNAVVVATSDGGRPIVIIGRGVKAEAVVASAESVTAAR